MTNPNRPGVKLSLVAALWAFGVAASGPAARADLVDLTPTGPGGAVVAGVAGLDLAPGNALARGSLPLTVGKTFQLYYQASVSGFIYPNRPTSTPAGLGSSYQLTAVASFTQVVRSVNAANSMATFSLAPTQVNSFFELYYSPTVAADSLAGTGFNLGTLILAATPSLASPSIGSFTNAKDSSGNPIIQNLDQFNGNDYSGVSTTSGSGSSQVTADVTFINRAFFGASLNQLTFNSSLVTAFAQTNPSARFLGHSGAGAPDITPALGSINGFNGADFQFQADANFSFGAVTNIVTVPEPASLLQAGLGLIAAFGGFAWKAARRRAPAAGA